MKTIKNKKIIIISVIVIVLILLTGIFAILKKTFINDMSKYEWVEMLSTQFNMIEYKNSTPYYVDVTAENDHFSAVQSSYEWKVLEDADSFDGDKKITGEYAALTAMKAIGEYKIKLYLGLDDLPTEDELINLALEKELISSNKLKKKITNSEAQAILDRAYELYKGELWIDDYYNYEYAEGVVELSDDEIANFDDVADELQFVSNIADNLSEGTIVVFTEKKSGFKVSKRIERIIDNKTVLLSDVQLEETLDYFTMSDIFTSDDVFEAMAQNESGGFSSNKETEGKYTLSPVIDIPIKSKGVSISLKITESEAEVTIKSNDTGEDIASEKYSGNFIKKSAIPDIDEEYVELSVDVTKINIGVQTDYSIFNKEGYNYFLAQVETELETKFEAGGNVEAVVPLTTITLAGSDLIAAVDLELKLVISMDGKVSITADFPSEAIFEYRRDSGERHYANTEASVETEICCSLEEKVRFEPVIVVLKKQILDLELDIGAGASASIKSRNNSNVRMCLDISSYMPILSLGYLNDEESLLAKEMEAGELEILTADNAPFKESLHYEWYKDGSSKLVPKCTYEGDDSALDISPPHMYLAKFTSDFKKVKDHYEAKGTVISQVYIEDEVLANMSLGDGFTFENESFILTDMGEYRTFSESEEPEKYYIFDGEYLITTGNWSYQDSAGFITHEMKTLNQDSMKPIQQMGETFYNPSGDKKVYIEITDDYTIKTLDGIEPYFVPIEKNTWYSLNFAYGDSDESNDVAGRLAGADIFGLADIIYVIE